MPFGIPCSIELLSGLRKSVKKIFIKGVSMAVEMKSMLQMFDDEKYR
jgi:hypothetical protein